MNYRILRLFGDASRRRPWLELLRVPNLFSAPGDPWAGAAVGAAFAGRTLPFFPLLAVGAAALCLYAFGLILNDWADRERDRRERPDRPLPRGAVRAESALAVACGLALAGLCCAAAAGPAAFTTALFLLAAVLAYDLGLKRHRFVGSLAMGTCRGLSVLLGGAIVGISSGTLALAAADTAYIAAVTRLADAENRPSPPAKSAAFLPAAFFVISGPAVLAPLFLTRARIPAPTVGLAALAWFPCVIQAVRAGRQLRRAGAERDAATYRRGIVLLLRTLVPWQCVWLLGSGRCLAIGLAGLLLAGMPIAARLGRKYSGS